MAHRCGSGKWRERDKSQKNRSDKKLKMATIAAQMPVAAFCYGNKEQLDCLARLELYTIEDM